MGVNASCCNADDCCRSFFWTKWIFLHATGIDYWFATFTGSAARIAVNMFLMLGCWFMVDSKYNSQHITRLYFNVWSLTVPITLVVFLLGLTQNTKDIMRGFFPFIGKGVWFASAYLMLMLFSPWLHKVLEWPKDTVKKLLIMSSLFVSLWVTLYTFDRTEDQWLDILVWFSFIYVFIGYYKKYLNFKCNKYVVLFLGLLFYFILALGSGYCAIHTGESKFINIGQKLFIGYLSDYKTLPNFIISFCIFYFFQRTDIGSNKNINFIATGAFSTYIIHQTPVFIHVLWYDVYKCDSFLLTPWRSLYAILVILSTYFICLLVECVRRKWIENIILETRFVLWIEKKLDLFYRNVI